MYRLDAWGSLTRCVVSYIRYSNLVDYRLLISFVVRTGDGFPFGVPSTPVGRPDPVRGKSVQETTLHSSDGGYEDNCEK